MGKQSEALSRRPVWSLVRITGGSGGADEVVASGLTRSKAEGLCAQKSAENPFGKPFMVRRPPASVGRVTPARDDPRAELLDSRRSGIDRRR